MKRKIKIFIPNINGKFEFTKEELEELINEAYEEGYSDGRGTLYWPPGTRHIEKDITWDWRDGPTCTNELRPAEKSISISYEGEVPKAQLYGCIDNCMELVNSNCIDNCVELIDSNCIDNCIEDYTTLCDNLEKSVSSNKMVYAHL